MSRHIVICGATGFIGRNITESLAASSDYRVTAVHHLRPPFECKGISWRKADLIDRAQAEAAIADADIVIQAAATTSGVGDIVQRPHIHIADNAVMNSHLLRAAFERGIGQFIFFSCSIMYPSSPKPQREDDFDASREIEPRYFGPAWTKLYIERMCEFYSRIGKTRFTVIRHSNVYGPHDKFDLARSHVTGATITKAMTSADDHIVMWGDGSEARDLLYISDLAEFVRLAMKQQRGPFGHYNVGAGSAITVRALAEAIVKAAGKRLTIEWDKSKPTIPTSISLDCGRALAEFGWKPKVSLAEGLRRTIDWYSAEMGINGAIS